MYYRLNDTYLLRGWQKLPYALCQRDDMTKRPIFFKKDDFMRLLTCNGIELVNEEELDETGKKFYEELLTRDIIECSETPLEKLKSIQRYRVFKGAFIQSVHWSITGRCNYRCRHCLVGNSNQDHPQLPLSDCLKIVDQLAECGIFTVDITGGEPLVRNDFIEIVKALSNHGIRIRTLFTNGKLVDEEFLKALAEQGQYPGFQISFDGLGHHDWLRGVPGAEEDACRVFHLLHERGIPYSCGMCIHKGNKDSLADTVRYLSKNGCHYLNVNTPQELGNWRQYSEKYALSMDEAFEVYLEYIPTYFKDGMPMTINLDGFFNCTKGSTDYKIPYQHHLDPQMKLSLCPFCESLRYNAHINPTGTLLPCMGFADYPEFSKKMPNVLIDGLGKSTVKSAYVDVIKTTLQDLIDTDSECKDCEHFNACCGGCMLAGMTEDGNCIHHDPSCCYFHKHQGEAPIRKIADAAIQKYQKNGNQVGN